MRKINKIVAWLVGLVGFGVLVSPVFASVLSIQQLPSYITTNSFKLSCTSDGSSAQFYVSKNGGAFNSFGPAIDLTTTPCQVQVTSGEINDQTNYTFKVVVSAGEATTSTFYDISGPSPVQNYYKEQAGTGFFKLHWKNPGDSDFDKVVIYRGDAQGFSADSSHEIARVPGGANSDMTYDDHQPDSSKTYYYALRALDKAGNSSSLVGDAGTTTTSSTTGAVAGASTAPKSTKVTQLPKEEGQVLGGETGIFTPAPEVTAEPAEAPKTGLFNWIFTHKKISLGILLLVGVVAYFLFKKRK